MRYLGSKSTTFICKYALDNVELLNNQKCSYNEEIDVGPHSIKSTNIPLHVQDGDIGQYSNKLVRSSAAAKRCC